MKEYKPVLITLIVAVAMYALHKTGLILFAGLKVENPVYTLEKLYLFFTVCSIAIIMVLVKISQKSFDNVGMSFLVATGLKMILCYFMLRPILSLTDQTQRMQKIGFFLLFILFLAIETVITIRILNKKQ